MNEEGLNNLRKIGDYFGIERCESNLEYKNKIAEKLEKEFGFVS